MMSKRRVGSWVLVCMALGQAACTSMRSVELAGDGVPAAVELFVQALSQGAVGPW
jgi:hypothetical protein